VTVGYYLRPATMNAQQYEALIERLEASGNGSPEGRLHHSCFGSDEALRVWEIWESEQAFEAFAVVLMPALEELGLPLDEEFSTDGRSRPTPIYRLT
jgi:hypothetical protein